MKNSKNNQTNKKPIINYLNGTNTSGYKKNMHTKYIEESFFVLSALIFRVLLYVNNKWERVQVIVQSRSTHFMS